MWLERKEMTNEKLAWRGIIGLHVRKVFLFADIFAHMDSVVFRLNKKFLWFLCQGSGY